MTTGVRLRAVEDGDLDLFFAFQADPAAAEMAAFPARERAAFDAHWAKIRADETVIQRTVLVDGAVAGNIGSWPDGDQRLIGYWIGRDYWGDGVASRALALYLEEVVSRPVSAFVAAHNAGSIRVLEKCGFKRDLEQEALMPAPEDGVEEHIYVLTA